MFVWCRQVRDTLQAEGLKSESDFSLFETASQRDRVSKRPRLKDGISLRLPPNPPREFDQQFPENCWSNAKRLFVNTLKHDSSGSDLRQIIRNVWECLTEAEGEVIRQEAGLTAVLHHKSSKRLSQAVAQCAVGKKESPGSVKRRVNGLV